MIPRFSPLVSIPAAPQAFSAFGAPFATEAAPGTDDSGSGGARPLPPSPRTPSTTPPATNFTCSVVVRTVTVRVQLPGVRGLTPQPRQVRTQICTANDAGTTALFKAVAHSLNVLYDNSPKFLGSGLYVDGKYDAGVWNKFTSLPGAVRAAGITWAKEDGTIDANTAALYSAIVATGAPVGQASSTDVVTDQKYVATNAHKIITAISALLAKVGVNLPVPTVSAPTGPKRGADATVPTRGSTPPPGSGTTPTPTDTGTQQQQQQPTDSTPSQQPQQSSTDTGTQQQQQQQQQSPPQPTCGPGTYFDAALNMCVPMEQPISPPPVTPKYGAGCVARFNQNRKVFSIYCPITPAGGFGAIYPYSGYSRMFGDPATEPTPPPPAGTVKAGEEAVLPPNVPKMGNERDAGFFNVYNPWMWATIAGTVAVAGGGGYYLYRRRRG